MCIDLNNLYDLLNDFFSFHAEDTSTRICGKKDILCANRAKCKCHKM